MKRKLHCKPGRIRWALLCLALFASFAASSQTTTVTGTVRSDAGDLLPGVNVMEKGTTRGTVTDAEGKFVIETSPTSILVFSFIGMANKEVSVSGQSSLDVVMTTDITQLGEVVVVGYGTQKKSDVTGSLSSISSQELKGVPVTSMSQALQGRAAGVQVRQTSNAPGGGVSIRVRGGGSITGGNEPLYVVDGYPLYNENGPTLNPNDIESVEILKDASATAIYGSRGANGVVIITTKRGRQGSSSVLYETYYGVQEVRKKLDMLNATELALLINEGIANTNADTGGTRAPAFTDEQIAALGEGTNWQDEIFRRAPVQNHSLTISGGSDRTQYLISGNYYDQQGIVINSDYQRASFRFNFDHKVSDKFKVTNSLALSRAVSNGVTTDTDGGSGAGVVYGALNFSPTVPVRNPDGTYTIDNRPGAIKISNPVALANEVKDEDITQRVLGNVSGEYTLLDGLSLKILFGANLNTFKNNSYTPRTVFAGVGPNGRAGIRSNQSADVLNENTINYRFSLNQSHKFDVLLGYTLQYRAFEEYAASAQNFANDVLEENNLGTAQQTNTSTSNVNEAGLRSYIGRVNYDFDGRFLATLTGRIDGSSRFGQGNKNAFFPSGSVAWRVSKEKFMQDVSTVSDLKFRVSYGLSGNQEIGNYQSLGSLSTQNYNFGNTLAVGYSPNRIANPNLKWETTAQLDIGVDVGLLQNRISITADWYSKKTDGLLYNIALPITSGFNTSLQNIGEVENKGWELALNTVNLDGKVQWTTGFNLSFNRNKLVSLGSITGDIPVGGASGHLQLPNSGILRVGEPIGVFYGLVTDGIFQSPEEISASAQKSARVGDRRYIDQNDDGVINSGDRVILGQAQPKYIFGFSNNLSYKGFDLSIFFQGVQGNSVFNINRYELESLTGVSNQSGAVRDRWTESNPSNTIPKSKASGQPYQVTSRQVEDGSYIRLRNIQLGYNFPSAWLEKIKLSSAKLYVSGQNLLTITNYSGFDPEVSRYGQDTLSQGIDYGSYPVAKMYLLGLNIGF